MVLADGENRGPAFDFDSFVADCSQTMHCSGTRSKRGWPVPITLVSTAFSKQRGWADFLKPVRQLAQPQVGRDGLGMMPWRGSRNASRSAGCVGSAIVAPLVDAGVHVLDRDTLLFWGQQVGEVDQAGGVIDEPVAGGWVLVQGCPPLFSAVNTR